MTTTRDRVDAYTHEARRQIGALLRGPDAPAIDPRRRLNRSVFAGAIIGVLILAVTGVLGLLRGGAKSGLPDSGTVLVEGSGDRYVVIDHTLHPALNLASAKLVGGAKITMVQGKALHGAARGLPVGIPGAPDALPGPSALSDGDWTACVVPAEATDAKPHVSVLVGSGGGTRLAARSGVYVSADGKTSWLLAGGWRYAVPTSTRSVLPMDTSAPVRIPAELLNTVPEAPALQARAVPRAGDKPDVSLPYQAKIGDLVSVPIPGTGDHSYYVVLSDGVAPIKPLAYNLLAVHAPDRTLTLAPGAVLGPQSSQDPPVSALWPDEVPTIKTPGRDQPVCVTDHPTAPAGSAPWSVGVSVPPAVSVPAGVQPVTPTGGSLPTITSAVVIAPGTGALIRSTTSGGADGVLMLVTDNGLRYPIASTDAADRLGYDAGRAVPVPLPFTGLLPAGPALDEASAAREYTGAAHPGG